MVTCEVVFCPMTCYDQWLLMLSLKQEEEGKEWIK